MSQCAVLALTQLSKVLKEINFVIFSGFDPFLKGLEMNWIFTNPMIPVLEGNLFPPRLTQGLERSFSAFVSDCVLDSVGIILSSDDSYAIYIRVLKGVNLCLCCSFLACMSARVLKGVSVHACPMTHVPSTLRVLKESTHVCFAHFYLVCQLGSWKESWCMSLQWLLCHLHQGSWKESLCMYT